MIFFDDQTIKDHDNDEKIVTSNEYPINLDLVLPPMVHDDDGENMKIDIGDTIDDDTLVVDDVNIE